MLLKGRPSAHAQALEGLNQRPSSQRPWTRMMMAKMRSYIAPETGGEREKVSLCALFSLVQSVFQMNARTSRDGHIEQTDGQSFGAQPIGFSGGF